jgi:hypothetical protein
MTERSPLALAEAAAAEGDAGRIRELFAPVDGPGLPEAERLCWCLLLVESGAFDSARAALQGLTDPGAPVTVEALLATTPEVPSAGGRGGR